MTFRVVLEHDTETGDYSGTAGDPAHRIAEGVAHFGVEVEEVVFVWKSGCLEVGDVPARGVLAHERFPARAPRRRAAEGVHAGRLDGMHFAVHVEIGTADEAQAGVVVIIVSPI